MIHVYLTPLDDAGQFTDEIEITNYVDLNSIGSIKRSLNNSTYDVGILRYNSLSLKLLNASGKFSDVENLNSVFRYSRSGSKVRITWEPGEPAICGLAICGECIISEEVTIFRGILNDDATKMDIAEQVSHFQVLSFDSQFSKVLVPYADLVAGDSLSEILIKILDQEAITKYATVDPLEINLQIDFVPDDITWFENKTGKEAIEKILLISNSVIYMDDETLVATGREPTEEVQFNFYGQASQIGNENIVDIKEFRDGRNRVINHVRWNDNGAAAVAPFSVEKWGVYTKEIDAEFVTDPDYQLDTAEGIVEEFKDPKKEFELVTFLDAQTLELKFKDKVDIDYPSVLGTSGARLPVVGATAIGDETAPLPGVLWDFQLTQESKFKIMEIEMNLKNETISFGLRGA